MKRTKITFYDINGMQCLFSLDKIACIIVEQSDIYEHNKN